MLIRLQRYDNLLRYQPGKKMVLADTLSRPQLTDFEDVHFEFKTLNTLAVMSVMSRRLNILREETQKNPTLAALQTLIREG